MRKNSTLVMDEFIMGTTAVYTAPEHNDVLGQPERMAVQVVVDQVSGTSPTVALVEESSSDQRNWIEKQTLISATSVSATATTVLNGYETGTNPSHGFVRFKITLGGTNPIAHVKIWVTGRDLL